VIRRVALRDDVLRNWDGFYEEEMGLLKRRWVLWRGKELNGGIREEESGFMSFTQRWQGLHREENGFIGVYWDLLRFIDRLEAVIEDLFLNQFRIYGS